jgi:23S rRNA pseudouridine1911/1915/1917 synthase
MTEAVERIPAALAGERVDRVVALITGLSRAEAAALVEAGEVRVNGAARTTRSTRLEEDDELAVRWEPRVGAEVPEADGRVPVVVVHEDADVIVVDKPAGLVVHPGAGHAGATLVHGLLARFPELAGVGDPERPGIVHRLDKETSGLLMVARSPLAYESLVDQLSRRRVDRRYDALVWGAPTVDRGTVDAPVGRSTRSPTRMTVTESGRPAVTHYAVVRRFHDPVAVSLLSCRLETGRTHQIRVHLRSIGHPVVGDERYRGRRQSLVAPRLFLHAAELGFTHPITKEPLTFTSRLPDDLAGVLAGLA